MQNNRKTGLSTSKLTRADFESYKKSGIDCLEISLPADAYDEFDIKEPKALADEYGIELRSFHLRFWPFEKYDISVTDDEKRMFAVNYHKKFIKMCAEAGIKIFIIHASGEPIEECDRDERIEKAKLSLADFAEYASRYDAVIAVEDLPRTCLGRCSDDIKRLISADDRLRVCFDTNHLLIEKNKDYIEALGDKFIATHFSDYDFVNERHWLPGEGDIDWCELMDALDKVGYSGPVLYELGLVAPVSIIRPRDLTHDDFVKNHAELEARIKPTAIGKRNMEIYAKK